MNSDNTDYDYFKNKRTDRVYLSKSLEGQSFQNNSEGEIEELVRPFRVLSKVIDCEENHKFIKDGKEISLRITDGERQEIKAKFYEDTRGISTLTIQKFTIKTGLPHNTYFTFIGNEIEILFNFIRNIALIPIKDKNNAKLDDKFVQEIVLTKEQALNLIHEDPELLKELIDNQISKSDIVNLGYRKSQLIKYGDFLKSDNAFEEARLSLGKNKKTEDVWQNYFQTNTWVFGYGLNYILNTPLDGKKLEQVVKGNDVVDSGKRVDALLKTQGIISSLCFVEIKTHKKHLLKQVKDPYRAESWAISDELAGAIAQVQRTVQISLRNIKTKTQIKTKNGELTKEELFLYEPKSYLVIGSLSEFEGEHGINEEKFSSFEMFRRNLKNPEIITFDELYSRAKYIVESNEEKA